MKCRVVTNEDIFNDTSMPEWKRRLAARLAEQKCEVAYKPKTKGVVIDGENQDREKKQAEITERKGC